MMNQPIAILESGLVCSVGLNAPAACAAIRAAVTNHKETQFMDQGGEWIIGASVPLEKPWRGRAKLLRMLAMAIRECLSRMPGLDTKALPLLLCVAERERAGRIGGLEEELFNELQDELGISFQASLSSIIPQGRVGVALALAQARKLIVEKQIPFVLIAGADGLLVGPALSAYENNRRLLTSQNSNGFIPGEAGSALLVGKPALGKTTQLLCTGLGYAIEPAHIDAEDIPLRAEGLSQAIKAACAEAGQEMADVDFRITDNSGEQYYFKEAALALARTLRKRKEECDIWHPADCFGEIGAAVGPALVAVGLAGCRKAYTPGHTILFHMGNDSGQRAAMVCRYTGMGGA